MLPYTLHADNFHAGTINNQMMGQHHQQLQSPIITNLQSPHYVKDLSTGSNNNANDYQDSLAGRKRKQEEIAEPPIHMHTNQMDKYSNSLMINTNQLPSISNLQQPPPIAQLDHLLSSHNNNNGLSQSTSINGNGNISNNMNIQHQHIQQNYAMNNIPMIPTHSISVDIAGNMITINQPLHTTPSNIMHNNQGEFITNNNINSNNNNNANLSSIIFNDHDNDSDSDLDFHDDVQRNMNALNSTPSAAVINSVIPILQMKDSMTIMDNQRWMIGNDIILPDNSNNNTNSQLYTEMIWQSNEERHKADLNIFSEMDFYNLMFPQDIFPVILDSTNANLAARGFPPTTKGELYRMFGIRLAMVIDKKRFGIEGDSLDPFFNSGPTDPDIASYNGSIFQPLRYTERFRMFRHRFEELFSCWSLDNNQSTANESNNASLTGVFAFLYAFNNHRVNRVKPGHTLGISESYTQWSGWHTKKPVFTLPQLIDLPSYDLAFRDTQLKCCVDSVTGIMLRLEFVETEQVMVQKKYRSAPHNYSAETALVMRLSEPWHQNKSNYTHGSSSTLTNVNVPRTIVVHRAFSSVECLLASARVGLKFMGSIKKHQKMFPYQYLLNWYHQRPKSDRGVIKILHSDYKVDVPNNITNTNSNVIPSDHSGGLYNQMHAVMWKSRKPTTLLMNTSTTEPIRSNVVINAFGDVSTVSYPKCIDNYYKYVSAANVHDFYREGVLGIENSFQEMNNSSNSIGWQQLFASIWGVIITDAFLAYRYVNFQYSCLNIINGDSSSNLDTATLSTISSTNNMNSNSAKQFQNRMTLYCISKEDASNEFLHFLGRLAHQMIENNYDGEAVELIKALTPTIPSHNHNTVPTQEEHRLLSVQVAIKQLGLENSQRDWQLKCKVCGGKTRKYCVKCSDVSGRKLFGICNDSTIKLKQCIEQHRQHCCDIPS